jgi:hypothetical protein
MVEREGAKGATKGEVRSPSSSSSVGQEGPKGSDSEMRLKRKTSY